MTKKPTTKTTKLRYLTAEKSFLDPLREDRGENC